LEPEVLDGGDAPPHAVLDAPVAQVVEHAQLLDHPEGVVERQDLHERAETDRARDLCGGRQEHLLVRRHAQVGAVVFGEVVGVEAGLVGDLDEVEPVSEQLAGVGPRNALDVVEDAELHHVASPCTWWRITPLSQVA
jgi:hypothetical protein